MSEKIGVGVIGCGVRGQHSYEWYLAQNPHVKVVAVSQYEGISQAMLEGKDAQGHAREYAAKFGAAYCANPQQLLARDDVQVVSLMAEPKAAAELALACVAAGKHIVRDKPMCLTLAEADSIVAAVEAAGVQMLVTLGTRYSGPLRTARENVLAGKIGELLVANFLYVQSGGPLEGFTATQEYLERVGGGEVTNFGHYALDTLNWIVGREVSSVYATMASAFYPDYQAIGMEDFGQIALRYEGGVVGTMVTGRTTTTPRPAGYYRLDLTGTEGTVRVDALGEEIEVYSGGQRREPWIYSANWVQDMVDDFVDGLLEGRPAPIGPRDGRAVMRILEAAYRSAREGKVIRATQ